MTDTRSVRWMTIAALFAIAASACRGTSYADPSLQPAASGDHIALGAYDFVARLPDGTQVQGQFAILRDTIIVDSRQALCKPTSYTPRGAGWSCQGVGRYGAMVLSIDAYNPGQRSRWSVTDEVRQQRRVCAVYVITPQGQRTNQCARWQYEDYTVPQRRTGVLEVSPRGGRDTIDISGADP